MNEHLDEEELSEEAVLMLNEMTDKFVEKFNRQPTVEELEYIREKVMLTIFGFYAREKTDE